MRYLIQEKILCLGDDFTIQDTDGRQRLYVDGRAFKLLRERLDLRDGEGNTVGFIRQKLLSLRKAYEIHLRGRHAATVSKDILTLFRCSFTVDVPGPDDYEAQGSFLDHSYEFRRGGRVVATVSKRWITLRDTYSVEIDDGEDDLLILASAIVIDQICHDAVDNPDH
jgi:uncharacterized protein YxjI